MSNPHHTHANTSSALAHWNATLCTFVVRLFYGFCISTKRKTPSPIMIICACDKQTKDSIHIGATAAASGPAGNHKIFSSEKIFSLISPGQRDGKTRIWCRPGTDVQVWDWDSYYVEMDIYVLDKKNMYKDIEWLMYRWRIWRWNTINKWKKNHISIWTVLYMNGSVRVLKQKLNWNSKTVLYC